MTSITLKNLFHLASEGPNGRKALSSIIRTEIPSRLQSAIRLIDDSPLEYTKTASVKRVRGWMSDCLKEVSSPQSHQNDKFLSYASERVLSLQSTVVSTLAKGLIELHKSCNAKPTITSSSISQLPPIGYGTDIRSLLDKLLLTRLGITFLTEHYLALDEADLPPGYAGVISNRCRPAAVARDAAFSARDLCLLHHMVCPEFVIREEPPNTSSSSPSYNHPKILESGDAGVRFTHAPAHLYVTLFEILKNAATATLQLHQNSVKLPPVLVNIWIDNDAKALNIAVNDNGPGMTEAMLIKATGYEGRLIQAAALLDEQLGDETFHSHGHSAMQGYGFGMAVSRLYTAKFGGKWEVKANADGNGTTVLLSYPLDSDAPELCPLAQI